MGMVMLAPGIWTLPESGTQASRRGPCLAVATCESVVPRLSCTTGHSRGGQCCLAPGEKEVYWHTENERVYFLPVLSKNSASVTPKCLRHFSLLFKPFKVIAVKSVLAHKSDHAPHLLLSFFLFPLKAPKFISFVSSWKLGNALAALLGFISFSFSLSHRPFSNFFCLWQPCLSHSKAPWSWWFYPSKNFRVHFQIQPQRFVQGEKGLWLSLNCECPRTVTVLEHHLFMRNYSNTSPISCFWGWFSRLGCHIQSGDLFYKDDQNKPKRRKSVLCCGSLMIFKSITHSAARRPLKSSWKNHVLIHKWWDKESTFW